MDRSLNAAWTARRGPSDRLIFVVRFQRKACGDEDAVDVLGLQDEASANANHLDESVVRELAGTLDTMRTFYAGDPNAADTAARYRTIQLDTLELRRQQLGRYYVVRRHAEVHK